MKFIFTADWHFSAYSNDQIEKESGLPIRLDSLVKTINNMILFCKEKKIKNIIVGGDILHNKNIIYSLSLSILIDLIKNNSEINFIVLDGNHDMSSRTNDGVSGLKALDAIKNVHTIHTIEKIENILFIPWKFATKDIMKSEKSDFLISHFGLNEAQLNSGISIVSDVSMSNLSNFNFVLLGHYHRNQFLKNKNTNLYYVGSPIQLDWGEKNEEKRFLVVDTEKNTIESVPTSGYKKYCEFNITEENKLELLKELKELKNSGHYVKLNKTNDLDTSDLENEFDVIDKREKDITNRGITSSMSISDKLNRFIEIKEVQIEKRDDYRNVALDIISSVSERI